MRRIWQTRSLVAPPILPFAASYRGAGSRALPPIGSRSGRRSDARLRRYRNPLWSFEGIKYLEWISVFLLIVLGLWITAVVLGQWNLREVMAVRMPEADRSAAFYFDLAFGFCWGWAMIGDFGRFGKTARASTVGSWLGVNLGQGWFMLIGAIGVIGVVLDTGIYDPNNSDPSSTIAALGLGTVALIVVFIATVSTNATVLYGAGMG